MDPMHLPEVEGHRPTTGPYAEMLAHAPPGQVPQIMHLFAWRPEATDHLRRFTQAVMRESRHLSPGQCELIAAVVSGKNDCLF
jgi:alkylhydroperoxidase family enzyme